MTSTFYVSIRKYRKIGEHLLVYIETIVGQDQRGSTVLMNQGTPVRTKTTSTLSQGLQIIRQDIFYYMLSLLNLYFIRNINNSIMSY